MLRTVARRKGIILTAVILSLASFIYVSGPRQASSQEAAAGKGAKASPVGQGPEDIRKAYERANRFEAQTKNKVFRAKVTPNWFQSNTRFWYRNDNRGGAKEFILVDAERGTRQPAFDHPRLAAALTKASGTAYLPDQLPFNTITFVDDNKGLEFAVAGTTWKCNLTNYELTKGKKAEPKKEEPPEPKAPAVLNEIPDAAEFGELIEEEDFDPFQPQQQQKKGGKGQGQPPAANREVKSPDGKWTAFVKDHNVFLKSKDAKDAKDVIELTKNGEEKNSYGNFTWSPDSKALVAFRTEPGENLKAFILDSSPKDQLRPKVTEWNYRLPGDKVEVRELCLFDVEQKKQLKVDFERLDLGPPPPLRWKKDGRHFTFQHGFRGHQRSVVVEVDAHTGKTRIIIDEKTSTRLVRAKQFLQMLDDGKEILWTSERDGWNHLYLIDGTTGKVKTQITRGPWAMRKVEQVDEKNRQIWFSTSTTNLDHDPYYVHFYRINFDGTGLVPLTEGNGNHAITYSPDKKYLFDNYSRPDMAPVTELRRVSDGSLVCDLERPDVSALLQTAWQAPEPFYAKGRDGETDIWGVVYKPSNYNAANRYPVIEYIYAGPWTSTAPKTFAASSARQALAELGFFVVVIDGMGTPGRSRAFHDVSFHNNGDCGFPDRILWIKALARKYPCLDLERVGIYGHSGGGYSSTRALLTFPEFYKVAVSSSGNHDPRTYNLSYCEQWMGYPIGDHYKDQSNITQAHKLQGKLFLIHGEVDNNVVPSLTTMKVVDALIKANKDFDLLIMPGKNHGLGAGYFTRRTWDYFVRHLHGIAPPEVNGLKSKTSG